MNDPQVVGGGEVRQPDAAGHLALGEDHRLVGAVQSAPVAHPAVPACGARSAQQFLEDAGQRVGAAAAADSPFLGRQPGAASMR